MRVFQVECANCDAQTAVPLPEAFVQASCQSCAKDMWVHVFPALLNGSTPGSAGERILVEDESSCFYHPTKKAVVPCDGCGRFLCALCEIQLGGQRLCSACVETGVQKNRLKYLKRERVYYDRIALYLAILPTLLFWPTLISAPVAIYISMRHWRTPLSIVSRWRWRYVLAIILAGLQLAGWAIGALALTGVLFGR